MDFRFEQLEIWQDSIKLSSELFDIAEKAEQLKKFRFAEQLNGAALSISNNIAEGAGASSNREFSRFLSYSRSSIFEVANILVVFELRKIIDKETRVNLHHQLILLSRKIHFFRKKLTQITN
jgi:four helix bundle protein